MKKQRFKVLSIFPFCFWADLITQSDSIKYSIFNGTIAYKTRFLRKCVGLKLCSCPSLTYFFPTWEYMTRFLRMREDVSRMLFVTGPSFSSPICKKIYQTKIKCGDLNSGIMLLWAHFDSWNHLKKAYYLSDMHSSWCATMQWKYRQLRLTCRFTN